MRVSESPNPEHPHLRAYLGVRLEHSSTDDVRGALVVSSRCRTRQGEISLGAIATMADVAALRRANEAHPAPLVTSHLSLRVPASLDDGLLHGDATVVRAGRARVICTVRVTDERGGVVGLGSVSSDALTGGGSSHGRARQPGDDDFYIKDAPQPGGMPVEDFLALEPAGEAHGRQLFRMPFHEVLRNVNGVLHGGGATLLVEVAARYAARSVYELGASVTDGIDMHFLAPGLTGPFLASVEPLSGGSSLVTQVEVTDLGHGGRPVALGLVSLRRAR